MARWMAALDHAFTWWFYHSRLGLLPHCRLGLFLHCLNLSCPVICFGQNKEMAEATSYLVLFFFFFPYLVLKRSIWFHCFLGTYYFQENRPSPPCWEMRPMTLYSLPHPFNYSWPADMSMNPSWTSQLPTNLLAFHRYTIENRQAKPTPTILKSNQMIMFSSLEFWSSLLHSNSWVTKISAYSGNPISENMLFSKTIWSFRFWCHLL